MSFASPIDVGEYIILYHLIVSYTSLVIFSPNVYTSFIAQAVRAFLIAMMFPPGDKPALVAAGSFPALDIAVDDSLWAADLQTMQASDQSIKLVLQLPSRMAQVSTACA